MEQLKLTAAAIAVATMALLTLKCAIQDKRLEQLEKRVRILEAWEDHERQPTINTLSDEEKIFLKDVFEKAGKAIEKEKTHAKM